MIASTLADITRAGRKRKDYMFGSQSGEKPCEYAQGRASSAAWTDSGLGEFAASEPHFHLKPAIGPSRTACHYCISKSANKNSTSQQEPEGSKLKAGPEGSTKG